MPCGHPSRATVAVVSLLGASSVAESSLQAQPHGDRVLSYYPGLDGLRGIAVLAVLVYHAQLGFPGGPLAVSQFFTLSGYLITTLILRRGSFRHDADDLIPFWMRRYRRLAPAALVTIGAVVVFGATIATERQLRDLPGTVVAALGQYANWHFIFSGMSYVDLFQAPSPLQHFWSLAIEEQFYLSMPLLLLLLFRTGRSLRFITWFLSAGALASSGLMLLLFRGGTSIDRLYYGTDTRAAEILVGCVLAVVLHQRPLAPGRNLHRAFTVAGIVAAGITYWAWFNIQFVDPILYEGGFLVHAALTAVLIVTVLTDAGPAAALLATRPLALLGRMSYATYCFHWPIYLWLSPERTGTDGWTLFGLRAMITLALAAISMRYLELPVRSRKLSVRRGALPLAFATSVTVILVGTVGLTQREVHTDLAGLGVDTSQVPVAATMRVLVIHDDRGSDIAARLGRRDPSLEIRSVSFPCESAGAGTTDGVCDGWEATWSDAVTAFDPDVVLFHVTGFDISAFPDVVALGNRHDQAQWIASRLTPGFDLLTSRGARVVWARATLPADQAILRRSSNPFWLAMHELATTQPDVREVSSTGTPTLLRDLRTFRRPSATDQTRVLVLGDSVSKTIGYGLEQWGADTGQLLVWSAGTEGCGLVADGWISDRSGREVRPDDACLDTVKQWRNQVAAFRPDVVVVSSTLSDVQRRRLDEWPSMLTPGDRVFDDYLVDAYARAFDAMSSSGATVVWLQPLCYLDPGGIFREPDGRDAADPERLIYVRDVINTRFAALRPNVRFVDLSDTLCPGGRFASEVDGIDVRPDGAHFSVEGARWLAETFGHDIVFGR